MASKKREANMGPVCQYGTVVAFLVALSHQWPAEVLLAPVHRPVSATGIQAGALLSGTRPGETSPVHLCVALAVEASLVGVHGRITYPYRQAHADAQVRQRISDLQQELLTALQVALRQDTRVGQVNYPAWHQIPASLNWNADALAGFPVTYLDGHWVAGSPELPS